MKQKDESPFNVFSDELSAKIKDHLKGGTKVNFDWFSHVRWTPCGMYLDPCNPHPFKVRTESFQMDFPTIIRISRAGSLLREVI